MKAAWVRIVALACCSVLTAAAPGDAQDLFELEVFDFDSTPPGSYDVEFHTNAMIDGSVAPVGPAANHPPVHVSVEVTRGWTDRIETAVFLQTAPFGSAGSARFAGGHLRGKLQLGSLSDVPLRVAVSAEYAFNRAVFDREIQTFEGRAIFDYTQGRLSLVANPSLEIVTRGAEDGLAPVFDLSAGASWRLTSRTAVTSDYFSAASTTRHLRPESDGHHLVFGGLEIDVGSGWELSVSSGHCVTRREPWIWKSIIGYAF
jgi:hypothetical protein